MCRGPPLRTLAVPGVDRAGHSLPAPGGPGCNGGNGKGFLEGRALGLGLRWLSRSSLAEKSMEKGTFLMEGLGDLCRGVEVKRSQAHWGRTKPMGRLEA